MQIGPPIEAQQCIDSRHRDFYRRCTGGGASALLVELGIVRVDVIRWIQPQRMKHRMEIGARSSIHRAPRFKEAPKPRIAMRPRAAHDETVHSLRLLYRERLSNGSAGRESDDMGSRDVERIHERGELGSHSID